MKMAFVLIVRLLDAQNAHQKTLISAKNVLIAIIQCLKEVNVYAHHLKNLIFLECVKFVMLRDVHLVDLMLLNVIDAKIKRQYLLVGSVLVQTINLWKKMDIVQVVLMDT